MVEEVVSAWNGTKMVVLGTGDYETISLSSLLQLQGEGSGWKLQTEVALPCFWKTEVQLSKGVKTERISPVSWTMHIVIRDS